MSDNRNNSKIRILYFWIWKWQSKRLEKIKNAFLLGQKIRELRETKHLTQEVAAHKMKIHRTYLAGIESGVRNPSLTLICKMAKGLKVSPADLFTNQ